MLNAYIYDGIRTPFGRYGGGLASIRTDDLVAEVISTLVARSTFATEDIEDVILGCANQAGEDNRNVARHASLLAGLPVTVPGQTVNRLCASGLAAILDSARAITCGEGDLYLAGGVESMSRAPFVIAKSNTAFDRKVEIYDTTIGTRFPNPRLAKTHGNWPMPETAENVAREFNICRDGADRFAAASQAKYAAAKYAGFYQEEILPLTVQMGRKKTTRVVSEDEHPRPQSNLTALAKLKPLHDRGVVTAGNSSGINDGAAALFIGSSAAGEKAEVKPMARILSGAASGVEPRIMGVGPVEAIHKAVRRAGLTLKEMDIIEINEAFATQMLACLKLLKLDVNDSRINPNGGAIAIGHPLGASGARLALTAARQLQRVAGRYAVVSLCIGVGQGMAVVIERI